MNQLVGMLDEEEQTCYKIRHTIIEKPITEPAGMVKRWNVIYR
jgi:hypothetical protein